VEPGAPRDRISDLYHRALECMPDERGAFLEEACAGDAALRGEVESLLRYESDSARFLETPAVALGDLGRAPDRSQMTGRQLGPYAIVAPLGAGGMGEVYRARDSKLGRDVAIKILPSHFTADLERRARFAREARLLATLNHPHIGAIYGLEETDGVTALVLELVEGPTLADRLSRGPMPIADVLATARQIAEALDAAHAKGIVHRDLKPANVVLQSATDASSSDGRAKVLDFGLAKTFAARLGYDVTQQPSTSLDGTAEGRILGTPAYMSPEQARGQAVDKRTDIWAFGCVLFEMLAGRRAFDGETLTDTFARILDHEPDWAALPAETPASIRRLLERCLRKDPRKRLHDIADALIEIDDGTQPFDADAAIAAPVATRWGREPLAWIVAAALALALGVMALNGRGVRAVPPELVEFPIAAPDGSPFAGRAPQFSISPDGRHVAFVATSKEGPTLWVRSLSTIDSRELPGTQGAESPFWKPDSQAIGFFSRGELKTIQLNGGQPVTQCRGNGRGTWSRKDVIVFGQGSLGQPLQQVIADRRNPTPLTVAPNRGRTYTSPFFLPDGEHFLYLAETGDKYELRVATLTSPDTVALGVLESNATYAAGHLFFVRSGNLMAWRFDAEARETKGDPLHLGVQAGIDPPRQQGMFSVSDSGRLVYSSIGRTPRQLTWLDRGGRPVGTIGRPGVFLNLDLSPDGRRVAFNQVTESPGTDISVMNLGTGTGILLTVDPGFDTDPAWSPDGGHIVFNSDRLGGWSLFMRASDGSGADVPLVKSDTGRSAYLADWSPDNIIFTNVSRDHSASREDLWILPMSGNGTMSAFTNTKGNERNGAFSTDGRWVAYQSDATGLNEVYVRPFPNKDPELPISREGGQFPRWREDGKELFFVSPDGTMMAARIDTTGGFSAGAPQPLFPTQLEAGSNRPYAVAKDGGRFLIPLPINPNPPLRVVMDWRALLDR
jgi:eukaryotic-like serine/threonine-protein kinase